MQHMKTFLELVLYLHFKVYIFCCSWDAYVDSKIVTHFSLSDLFHLRKCKEKFKKNSLSTGKSGVSKIKCKHGLYCFCINIFDVQCTMYVYIIVMHEKYIFGNLVIWYIFGKKHAKNLMFWFPIKPKDFCLLFHGLLNSSQHLFNASQA